MYVAVKGGERAILSAHRLLAERRRGDPDVPELSTDQVREQLALGVARVMAEASLYAPSLAALALKQARGDTIEAVFLLRAYRTTLARFGYAEPLETGAMRIERRVSATYKDLPGGQVLGPTFDYTHRLLDPSLANDRTGRARPSDGGDANSGSAVDADGAGEADARETSAPTEASRPSAGSLRGASRGNAEECSAGADGEGEDANDATGSRMIGVAELLELEGLVETERSDDGADGAPPGDLTRTPLEFPAARDVRLQSLARGDEGFLLALAYSTQRGYGRTHPFVGEIRIGWVELELDVPELGFAVTLGEIRVTECQTVNQFLGSAAAPPQFTRGYGLVFGQAERKAMAMALVERALRSEELGEEVKAPAQDEEFVLAHADNVQASGFVEHLKLPHHVDFQAELELLRRLRAEFEANASATGSARDDTDTDPGADAANAIAEARAGQSANAPTDEESDRAIRGASAAEERR